MGLGGVAASGGLHALVRQGVLVARCGWGSAGMAVDLFDGGSAGRVGQPVVGMEALFIYDWASIGPFFEAWNCFLLQTASGCGKALVVVLWQYAQMCSMPSWDS